MTNSDADVEMPREPNRDNLPQSDVSSVSATMKEGARLEEQPATTAKPRTSDFWILPIPPHCHHNPEQPFEFTLLLNIIFGLTSTVTAANLYYCQPLLVDFTNAFNATGKAVSLIPTLTQAGYATGLLLITPLGDLLRRRPMLLALITMSMLMTVGAALAPNLRALQVLSYFLGIFSVTPQVLLPFAADLAPPHRRASVLAIVLSGLILGIIFARAIGGVVAFASHSWRNVFWIGVGLQGVMLLSLWWVLPDWPSKVEILEQQQSAGNQAGKPRKKLTYVGILVSMAKLAVTEPILIQGYLIGTANMAIFSNFWVTLTFLLADPPYNYSTLKIGLFGLVGTFGVITAPFVGRLVDGLVLWFGVLVAIVFLIISQVVMVGGAGINIGAVIVSSFTLDVGVQMLQVSITTHIYGIDPALRARLNAIYLIACFIGQVVGSAAGSHIFLSTGWRPTYGFSTGLAGFMLFALLLRGPHAPRYTWLGWKGGARLTKDKPSKQDVESGKEKEEQETSPGTKS